MPSAQITLDLIHMSEVRRLISACIALIGARNAGADTYPVEPQIAEIEQSLEGLGIHIPDSYMGAGDEALLS